MNVKDNFGNTPLMKACRLYGENNRVVRQQIEILIRFGADVYLSNNSDEFPLDLCPSEMKQELLQEIRLQNPLKRRRTLEESLEYDYAVEYENQKKKNRF